MQLDLLVKRAAWNAEPQRGLLDLAAHVVQDALDVLPFNLLQGEIEIACVCILCRCRLKAKVAPGDGVVIAEQCCALKHITELTDIAGPRILAQRQRGVIVNCGVRLGSANERARSVRASGTISSLRSRNAGIVNGMLLMRKYRSLRNVPSFTLLARS